MRFETLDLNFQGHAQAIASFLIWAPEGPILIESGPASTWEAMKSALAQHQLEPKDIKHVLVSHIHLDHAGALGWFAREGAKVYVHQVGAPHLIRPEKLLSSAGRIYGDAMDRLWGETLPVPEDKMVSLAPGKIRVAGLDIEAIDTPGHAGHHFVYQIEGMGFTGDAAGVRLEGSPFLDLPAPPPEFQRELWLKTLDLIQARKLDALYLTHFGRVGDVDAHIHRMKSLIVEASDFVLAQSQAGLDRDAVLAKYLEWHAGRVRDAGISDGERESCHNANPIPMSVDGMLRYWRKKQEN